MSSQETLIPKKKRGPKPTGQGVPVMLRLQPDLMAMVDQYIETHAAPKPSRPQAIRAIIRTFLANG
jgi:hypothetical protein